MAEVMNSENETQFLVDDSQGRVVVHTAANQALPKNSRMVAAGRNRRSVSASISTQVDESDLGIIEFDLQSDSNEDNEENEEEPLIAESSEALEPTLTANENKSEMSISTKRVTDMAVRKFREFVKSRDLSGSFEHYTAEELDSLLYEFYTDAKKKNGQKLKVSTLRTIRSSLDRHLKTESDKCTFTIAHSPIFNRSNKILEEVEATEIAERALDVFDESARVVKPLTADDVKTLWETGVIGTDEPKALQRLVFLIIGINFGITTRDDVRQLKPSLFLFCSDILRGLEFVQIDELQFFPGRAKKQKGKLENKIFSIPSSPYCPVAALKSYLEKTHPQQQSFYQTPNPKFRKENMWYKREAIGKNTLGRFMRDISVDAHLPHQYVNSSLRITPPEVLSQGISAYTLRMPYPYYSCPAGVQTLPPTNTVPNDRLTSSAYLNNHVSQSYQQSVGVTHNPSPSPIVSSNNRIIGTSTVTNTNVTFTAPESCNSDQPTPSNQSWPTAPLSVPHFTLGTPPAVTTSVSTVSTVVPPVSTGPTRLGVATSFASLQGNCIPVQTCPVLCLPYDWEMKDVVKVLRAGDALLLTKACGANHAQPASSTAQSAPPSLCQQTDGERFKQAVAVVNSKLGQLENRAMQEPRAFDALLELRQLQKNLNSFVTKVESGVL